jgi:hypothetical protein
MNPAALHYLTSLRRTLEHSNGGSAVNCRTKSKLYKCATQQKLNGVTKPGNKKLNTKKALYTSSRVFNKSFN